MKKVILSGLLGLLIGCGSDRPASPDPLQFPNMAEVEDVSVTSVENQDLLVQSTKVHIVRVSITSATNPKRELYLITTPEEKISFLIDPQKRLVVTDLSPQFFELASSKSEPADHVIDLKISEMINYYAIENVLNLDRCREVPHRQEVIDTLSSHRESIYFSVRMEEEFAPQIALRWEMGAQKFSTFVELSQTPNSGTWMQDKLILTPNDNVRDRKGRLLTDSAFISARLFNANCSSAYSLFGKKDPLKPYSLNDDYYPRFDPKLDSMLSKKVTAEAVGTNAFFSSNSIYMTYPVWSLNVELLNYAKNNSLFKTFGGVSNE